jgi:hypothetical protein
VIGLPARKSRGRTLAGGLFLTAAAVAAAIAAPAASAAPLVLAAPQSAAAPSSPAATLSSAAPSSAGQAIVMDQPAGKSPSGGNTTFSVVGATPKGPDGRYVFAYSNVKPGSVIHDWVELYNGSSDTGAFLIYGVDATGTTGKSSLIFDQATQKPKDLGTWMSFYASSTQPTAKQASFVTGGRHGIIEPFTITVPLTATPGDHTGGLIAQVGHQTTTKSGEGVTVYSRIVLPVEIRVTGPLTAGLQVQSVSTSFSTPLNPFATASASISYTVANVGNTRLSGNQALQVSGWFGSKTIHPDLPMVLPGSSIRLTQAVPGLYPFGQFTAKITITPAWPPSSPSASVKLIMVTSSASFFGVPWSPIVIIVLLAGLGYGTFRYLRWRVRARAADMAAVAAAARKDAERRLTATVATTAAAAPAAVAAPAAGASGATGTTGEAAPGSQGDAE